MPIKYRILSRGLILGFLLTAHTVAAQTGAELTQQKCTACHSISSSNLNEETRMRLKGPPLESAGIKYRADWVENWLQNPTRIRPGGMFFGSHTVVTDEGDVIDEATLSDHPTLDAEDATNVANYLMTLTEKSELVNSGEYKAKKVGKRMAAMNFRKFKGCSSCHQDENGIGGVSGPELYSAFDRLNPDFIVSFIRNPVAWNDVSLMPHTKLKDKEIQKLTHYLKLLSGEE